MIECHYYVKTTSQRRFDIIMTLFFASSVRLVAVRRLITKFCEVSKPRDWVLKWLRLRDFARSADKKYCCLVTASPCIFIQYNVLSWKYGCQLYLNSGGILVQWEVTLCVLFHGKIQSVACVVISNNKSMYVFVKCLSTPVWPITDLCSRLGGQHDSGLQWPHIWLRGQSMGHRPSWTDYPTALC